MNEFTRTTISENIRFLDDKIGELQSCLDRDLTRIERTRTEIAKLRDRRDQLLRDLEIA